MTFGETLILATYFFVLVILAVYGWHRDYLVYLYMRNRHKEPKPGPPLQPTPVFSLAHWVVQTQRFYVQGAERSDRLSRESSGRDQFLGGRDPTEFLGKQGR